MLTEKLLEMLQPGEVFAQGVAIDCPEDAHINRTGKLIRWVAVRGGIQDWAVYVGPYSWRYTDIAREGDKVLLETAQRLVPCDEKVIKRYRP